MPPAGKSSRKPARQSRIPSGRIERFARLGWLAGEVAIGGIAEAARRLTGTTSSAAASVFLSAANARRLAERLTRMRGAAMKLGQLLSLEGQDLLPPEVSDALSVLRAEADAMPESQLRRVLGRAYGKGWQSRFQMFGMTPVAAASIGQVHHAISTDGRELALKIQYPGVGQSIDSDVDNLAAILRLSRLLPGELDLSAILTEAKRQLRQETDYLAEAAHLRRYAELADDEDGVVVPRVHDDLTTRTILAMDFLPGRPLDDLATDAHDQRRRDRAGVTLYRLLFRELFEWRLMQTDPNFANYLLQPDGRIALLDYGATRPIAPRLSAQYERLFRAGMRADRALLAKTMLDIGFFDAGERADRVDTLVDLFVIGFEPFRHRGPYDFGGSTSPRAPARSAWSSP